MKRTFILCSLAIVFLITGCSTNKPKPQKAVDSNVETPEKNSTQETPSREKELADKALALLSLYENRAPSISDTAVTFVSDRKGDQNVYISALTSEEKPLRLSNSQERAVSPQFSRDQSKVIYLSDVGHNRFPVVSAVLHCNESS